MHTLVYAAPAPGDRAYSYDLFLTVLNRTTVMAATGSITTSTAAQTSIILALRGNFTNCASVCNGNVNCSGAFLVGLYFFLGGCTCMHASCIDAVGASSFPWHSRDNCRRQLTCESAPFTLLSSLCTHARTHVPSGCSCSS